MAPLSRHSSPVPPREYGVVVGGSSPSAAVNPRLPPQRSPPADLTRTLSKMGVLSLLLVSVNLWLCGYHFPFDSMQLQRRSFPWSVLVVTESSRKKAMAKNLNLLRPFTMIDAIDKKWTSVEHLVHLYSVTPPNWDWPDKRMRKAYDEDYVDNGEVACTFSHRRTLEHFVQQETDQEFALILEDDAIPVHGSSIVAQLEEVIQALPPDWDFVQLGRCWDILCQEEANVRPIATLSSGNHILPSRGFELCTHSYLVSKKGAETILEHSLPVVLAYVSHKQRMDATIHPSSKSICFVPSICLFYEYLQALASTVPWLTFYC